MEHSKVKTLVERTQNGDEGAFIELYNDFSQSAYYIALRITKSPEDADEVSSDSMMSFYRYLKSIGTPRAAAAYFSRIAVRHSLHSMEQNNPEKNGEPAEELLRNVAESNSNFIPEEYTEKQEMREYIIKLIDQLETGQRTVVVLYYYKDLTVKQISEAIGIEKNAVEKRLSRARAVLKEKILKGGMMAMSMSVLSRILRMDAEAAFTPEIAAAGWKRVATELGFSPEKIAATTAAATANARAYAEKAAKAAQSAANETPPSIHQISSNGTGTARVGAARAGTARAGSIAGGAATLLTGLAFALAAAAFIMAAAELAAGKPLLFPPGEIALPPALTELFAPGAESGMADKAGISPPSRSANPENSQTQPPSDALGAESAEEDQARIPWFFWGASPESSSAQPPAEDSAAIAADTTPAEGGAESTQAALGEAEITVITYKLTYPVGTAITAEQIITDTGASAVDGRGDPLPITVEYMDLVDFSKPGDSVVMLRAGEEKTASTTAYIKITLTA